IGNRSRTTDLFLIRFPNTSWFTFSQLSKGIRMISTIQALTADSLIKMPSMVKRILLNTQYLPTGLDLVGVDAFLLPMIVDMKSNKLINYYIEEIKYSFERYKKESFMKEIFSED